MWRSGIRSRRSSAATSRRPWRTCRRQLRRRRGGGGGGGRGRDDGDGRGRGRGAEDADGGKERGYSQDRDAFADSRRRGTGEEEPGDDDRRGGGGDWCDRGRSAVHEGRRFGGRAETRGCSAGCPGGGKPDADSGGSAERCRTAE